MGCFCETDGITQLPINYRDKVRLFVMIHTNFDESYMRGGGTNYSSDIWRPLGCVQGTYDDYGGIENIVDDFGAKILLSDFRKKWSKDITLEDALHCIEREEGVEYVDIGETALGFMMVLEDVYQTMVSFNPIDAEYNYENSTYMYKPSNEVIKNGIKDWYKFYSKRYNEVKGDVVKECSLSLVSDGGFFDFRNKYHSLYSKFFVSCIKEDKPFEDPEVQEAAQSLFEIMSFDDSMNAARKMWIPQTGKGAQHNELDIYKLIANTVNKISSDRKKKMEDDGWEMPDENGYMPYMIEHNKEQDAAKENK